MVNCNKYWVSTLIFTLFLFIGNTVISQNKQNFEKQFDKETSAKSTPVKKGKFKNVERLSYYPDTIPNWFFNPPVSSSEIYAIGISDPDMEIEKAKKLAIVRAKSNALIASEAKIQYFRDIYTSAKESDKYTDLRQRFDTYFKISASNAICDNMFAVLDTHITRYNEYIVLIKYTPCAQSPNEKVFNLTTIGTTLLIEASVDDAFEDQAEYELMSIQQDSAESQHKAHYLYREKGSRFLSNSEYENEPIDYPVYAYTYVSENWDETKPAFRSYNGLWSVYTRQLLNYLTLNCQQSSIKLKNMGQQYGSEMANLTREIASFVAKLKINGINFANDTLKFDLQVEETERLLK